MVSTIFKNEKDSNNKDSWLIEQWRIKQQLTHICKIYKKHYHTSADLSFPLSWECTEVWMGLLQARCWTDLNEYVHVSMRMLQTLALPLNLAVWQLWYNAPQTVYSNNELIFIFFKKKCSRSENEKIQPRLRQNADLKSHCANQGLGCSRYIC